MLRQQLKRRVFSFKGDTSPHPTQLELGIGRPRENDRNYAQGGRSFYFFDFDDNVAFLATPIYVFHKNDQRQLAISSQEFAKESLNIGVRGSLKEYEVILDDQLGTFRNFRDRDLNLLDRLLGKKQVFLRDLTKALGLPEFQWKGPSWSCFYHAVYNQRPISVITARGHHPSTIVDGIRLFVKDGHLPSEPNYLSVFPVSHPDVRQTLSQSQMREVANLKQLAIRASVEKAMQVYGSSPYHRFGMSDDDPKNIALIAEEMARLKSVYTEVRFFIIETTNGRYIKREVFSDHTESHEMSKAEQLALF